MSMGNLRVLVLALSSVLVLAGCGEGEKKQGPGGPGPGGMPAAEVEVITLAPATTTLTRDLPGRLQAVRSAQVRARVEGIVEKRLFVEGSDVKAGAALFRLDDRTYRTAATAAEADATVARLLVERYRPLLAMKAVSQQAFDQAEAKLKQAEAALAKARLDLENTTVPAPIAGRIGRAQVTEGALVGRGEATPLATIEQIDPIYANFTQPSGDLLRLQAALKSGKLKKAESAQVALKLEDGSLYPEKGRLLFSDLAVDPNTGSVSLRAEFPNPRHELLPGMYATVRLPEAVADNTLRVPQQAVQTTAQGQFVTVVVEGKAVQRSVKTGAMSGGDWVISEGLAAGDVVIVNGASKLRPNAPFKVVPAAAPALASPDKK